MGVGENRYAAFLAALLDGNRDNCVSLYNEVLAEGVPLALIYEGLLQRAMYEVGRLWETNQISIAREHAAADITEALLNLALPVPSATPAAGLRAVAACVADEHHQIGARMIADALRVLGWDCWFVGPDTTPATLLDLVDGVRPDLVGLSVSLYAHLPIFYRTAAALTEADPSVRVLVGGQAFRHGGREALARIRGVRYVPSVARLGEYLA